jgi:hypothetical protein
MALPRMGDCNVSDAGATGSTAPPPEGQPPAGQPPAAGQPGAGDPAQGDQQGDTTDWKAEAIKWEKRTKSEAEKAKANAAAAAELQKLQQAQMTENEKAVAAAKGAGAAEATQRLAGQMVTMAIKAAAAGRLDEETVSSLAESINPAAFISEDFQVDMDKVTRLVGGLVPKQVEEKPPEKPADPRFPDIGGQGAKGDPALNGTDGFLAALKASVGREQ